MLNAAWRERGRGIEGTKLGRTFSSFKRFHQNRVDEYSSKKGRGSGFT